MTARLVGHHFDMRGGPIYLTRGIGGPMRCLECGYTGDELVRIAHATGKADCAELQQKARVH